MRTPSSPPAATIVGLAIALAGPALPIAELIAHAGAPSSIAAGSLALWLLLAALVAIVLRWERRDLGSIGLRRPGWRSLAWGVAAAAVLLFVVSPATNAALAALAPGAYEPGLAKIRGSSLPLLVVAGVSAGVVEETLYRAYAIERLSQWSGSTALAAALALAAFAVAHVPFWGVAAALATLPAGLLLTLLYVARRDLAANVVAHATTATVQLLAVAAAPR